MKFHDDSQNLRVRLRIIHLIVLVILTALGSRLYYLQIVKGHYYAEKAEDQRIRKLPILAPRGVIYDRNGKVIVDSRPIYNVILSREDIKGKDLYSLITPFSRGLNLDPEILRERFDEIKSLPAFESIRIKENATPADISWVHAHSLEYPELRIDTAPQRSYPANGMLAHVLGYVTEIDSKQLENPKYKDKGYKPGDLIGQEGIEATYDQYLRGRDGYRKVVVDSRGRIQEVLEEVPPQPGQDLISTIDLDMQKAAEDYLLSTPSKRGVIVAMDPNNGEIHAMASMPTFDPNLFTQRIRTREGRAEYAALLKNPRVPLYNRAIRGRYPPGSTWKIPMGMAGLMQDSITIKQSGLACGGGIQIGNKFTRCMGSHGVPPLDYAIQKSCDGYFYRLGLKMGLDGIMKMVDDFDLNKRTGVDLPGEIRNWTPSREFKARWNPGNPTWKDIDTVYASFGQVYEFVTPLSMLRAVVGIGMRGHMPIPHLMKEAKDVGPVEVDGIRYFEPRKAIRYEETNHPEPKFIELNKEENDFVIEGMWKVVNDAGTGARIRMDGFDIAGKTGTAQVVSLGEEHGENKDHAWFVSFAPAFKPEISAVAIIENVGFGGTYAAPAVRATYDVYYRKTRKMEPPGMVVAPNTGDPLPPATPELTATAKPEELTNRTKANATASKAKPKTDAKPATKATTKAVKPAVTPKARGAED
jgi:penicillin-binding protein 2